MTPSASPPSLSRLELLVLAALTSAKPPSLTDLGKRLHKLAFAQESPGQARLRVGERVAALRARGLIDGKRHLLTEDGKRALCAGLGVARVPQWKDVQSKIAPALALTPQLGPDAARRALEDAETLHAALLSAQLGLPPARTINALCDALLAQLLNLPPGKKVTPDLLRAHALAQRAAVEPRGDAEAIAARLAAASVRAPRGTMPELKLALARRWLAEDQAAPADTPAQPEPAVEASRALLDQTLRALVQEAVSEIRVPGRFGPDKVFIAAIWQDVRRSPRCPTGLTLELLKRWLVLANAQAWLTLARADLVGAMDPELVAASEIEDRGATFHFVLDTQAFSRGR